MCKNKVLLLLFINSIIRSTNSKIYKLENETHIYCIDDDEGNKDVALFVSPPFENLEYGKNTRHFVWKDNDWNLTNGESLAISPIIDKRWQDLPIYQNEHWQVNLSTSVSFSVYTKNSLNIFVSDDENVITHQNNNTEPKWYHYTILSKQDKADIFENNLKVATGYFAPTIVIFRNSGKKLYFKLHQDNNFWWSNNESNDEKPSIIEIAPTGRSCLFLYSSLCEKCYLKVIQNDKIIIINSTKQNEEHLLEFWQTQEIKINPNETNIFKIYRKKYEGDSEGHWSLDFRLCDLYNVVTFKKKYLDKGLLTNYTCNKLTINSNETVEKLNNLKNEENECTPGNFGKNCIISCKNLIHQDFEYCDKHQICSENNSHCHCAWGYEGQTCTEVCENGKWGLSCKEECKKCDNCNKHTGECINNDKKTDITNIILIIIISYLVTLHLLFIILSYIYDKSIISTKENFLCYLVMVVLTCAFVSVCFVEK